LLSLITIRVASPLANTFIQAVILQAKDQQVLKDYLNEILRTTPFKCLKYFKTCKVKQCQFPWKWKPYLFQKILDRRRSNTSWEMLTGRDVAHLKPSGEFNYRKTRINRSLSSKEIKLWSKKGVNTALRTFAIQNWQPQPSFGVTESLPFDSVARNRQTITKNRIFKGR